MCFSYHGGKKGLARFIISKIPTCEIFIDVFGGMAAVAAEAVRSGKFNQVVYNDKNSLLFNLLCVIRDDADTLIDFLLATPVGRENFTSEVKTLYQSEDRVARAAAAILQLEYGPSLPVVSPEAISDKGYRRPSVRGVNAVRNTRSSFERQVNSLKAAQSSLLPIHFENIDWQKIIKLYSNGSGHALGGKTCFFLDPPYGESREYPDTVNDKQVKDFFCDPDPGLLKVICYTKGEPEFADFEYLQFPRTGTSKNQGFDSIHGMYFNFKRKTQLSLFAQEGEQ